jgi:arylsulfate sulfotransferase
VSETDVFPGGDILAQVGPVFSRIDRKGDLVDYMEEHFLHHDVDVLPWGNLLAITSREFRLPYYRLPKTVNVSQLYSRDDILEIDPETGAIVGVIAFEGYIGTDEICPACITTEVVGGRDWIHVNALDYDLAEQALYVSVRNLNRIYKMSYPEAEVEWVMGDGGDFGEGLFTHQHNPYRIAPGRMLVFDNGLHPDPFEEDRSRVIEIEYDPEARAARIVWEYDGPPTFYSEAQGDASLLANGNILVVDSAGPRIVEITRDGMPVWELTMPKPYVFYKAHRIENFP